MELELKTEIDVKLTIVSTFLEFMIIKKISARLSTLSNPIYLLIDKD